MPTPAAADLLLTIVEATRARVRAARTRVTPAALARQAAGASRRPGRLAAALDRGRHVAVIAECKRRSPSRGVLRRIYDPVAIARAYERAGAAAVSVLTEPTFFDGSLDHLRAVRAAIGLPILRKDFIIDRYQVLEAAAAGADAVLLIVAALDDEALTALSMEASALGLETIAEVHDAGEVDRALAAGARIIGVNNRNLRTLAVSLDVSTACASRLPAGVIGVSESGLTSGSDLRGLAALGYRAVLIGERFMTASDPGQALYELLNPTAAGAS